ncbi:thiol:disulfide interchange protein DsbA/DsbL [Colwellia psychrerythraea]|uniref:Thiol:disulfide interchange protein n=1 Tax=Colwellia psychrerythraea TaxID=28229 RepID=A0A099L5D1_COLPS|nr:thiol:disulfide interchange protein DsbA/DsbL [Colwellia psychrerythraea]KGJ97397.1 DSBA oxidoreductase [Colwellia psychrerythraea]
MKNNVNFIAVVIFVVATFSLFASQSLSAITFVKGTHYKELTTPINSDNLNKEVREFFSFYCPGCYRIEPIITALKAELPAEIPFIKNHIDGMPGRDLVIEQGLSRAILTAKLLKLEDQVSAAIFNYIHVNKATFNTNKDIKNIFLLLGVDGQRFDKVFNSFSVKTGVNKMNKATEVLRQQGITSVPTAIVNGKYKVETGALESQQQYIELVLYLLTL